MEHLITREIGIDAGHRVTYHGSKCRNLHGHRYTIQATCKGALFEAGEQQGMVLDFGFLKDEMMNEIDEPCDHGTILWDKDPLLSTFIPNLKPGSKGLAILERLIASQGYVELPHNNVLVPICGKMYVVPFVPTAENLARHWYERLQPRVEERTGGAATLDNIKVWETPNCSAQFPFK